jgi:RNase P protein component
MNEERSEAEIKAGIRERIGGANDRNPFAPCVIWQQATGHGKTDTGSEISFGLCRGSSDLIGIRCSDGKFIAIEVKTIKGLHAHNLALARAKAKHVLRQTMTKAERRALEQFWFVELVKSKCGLAGFATSEDEAERIVTEKS